MGMFDTIYVKKKLPLTKELKALDVNWEEIDFQTKDLQNLLDRYEITKAGKLRHLWQERAWKDDDNTFLKGYFEVVKEEWRDVAFHGTIKFYASYSDDKKYHWNFLEDPEQMSWEDIELISGYDWWLEFEAYFTKGKLDSIMLIKVDKELIKDRIKNNKEWSTKRAEENKKLHKRVINFLRKFKLYRDVIRYTLRFTNWSHSKLTWALYRL